MRPYIVMVGFSTGMGSFLFGCVYDTGIITTNIAHDSAKEYEYEMTRSDTATLQQQIEDAQSIEGYFTIYEPTMISLAGGINKSLLHPAPGTARGSEKLSVFIRKFTEDVLKTSLLRFRDFAALGKYRRMEQVVSLRGEARDYVLVEQYTYPSAQALCAPTGCQGVPMAMDQDSIIPRGVGEASWELGRGRKGWEKAFFVIYHSGWSKPYWRNIAYIIVICEDDPYYFLQLPAYAPSEHRIAKEAVEMILRKLVKSLVPTFLSLDNQGRVIRLETFSKTLGPGNCLGYFVRNPLFAERLLRATEVMSQMPSGWSQKVVEELLAIWNQEGSSRWLAGVMNDVVALPKGCGARDNSTSLFSYNYPKISAGMFLWIKLDLAHNPAYQKMKASGTVNAEEIWERDF
uniref:Putative PLP-dependent transferase n=1 Tax=Moniliophthora roreri TaxID=221103 RepID=A0A0W0EVL4_MONRR